MSSNKVRAGANLYFMKIMKMSHKEKKTMKAKLIEQAIELTYDSLKSHLPYTYGKLPKGESHKFHKKATKEYAQIILNLTKLY